MDLEAVRTFVKVAELGSFTRAAEHLGIPKSAVSNRVRALEEELGRTVLRRTTRVVQLTPDGEDLLVRARRLVADADDVAAMFSGPRNLRGRVRVDLPVALARELFIPRLPEWLAQNPDLELVVSSTDRLVDPVREGIDCVLRIGRLKDSGLIAKKLGMMRMANYASVDYLERFGEPRKIDDLDRHYIVNWGPGQPSFEYEGPKGWVDRPVRALVTVGSSDAYEAAAIAGLGIIQAPRWRTDRGKLREVLPSFTCRPMPVAILHAKNPPERVRALMTWMKKLVAPLLAA